MSDPFSGLAGRYLASSETLRGIELVQWYGVRVFTDHLGKVLHHHRRFHDGLAHLAREAQARITRPGEDGNLPMVKVSR